MKTIILATLASIITVTPALAEPTAAPTPTPVARDDAGPLPSAKRYCYRTEMTGSRIQKRVCRTRDQWKSEGVTVPASL